MTELLLRLFARNDANEVRHGAVGRLAGAVGIFCNCLFVFLLFILFYYAICCNCTF